MIYAPKPCNPLYPKFFIPKALDYNEKADAWTSAFSYTLREQTRRVQHVGC